MKKYASTGPLIAALALAVPMLARAAPPPDVQQDVEHLLAFIEKSSCSFYRNGNWSDSKAAQEHVRTKYDFLAGRDRISSTTDFIDLAATESSITHLPYQVRCAGGTPVLSGLWLREELARYKAAAGGAPSAARKPSPGASVI